MSADLRASEMRVGDLVSELTAREDMAARTQAEAADLRRVVAGMDAERDQIQVCMCVWGGMDQVQVGVGGGGGGRDQDVYMCVGVGESERGVCGGSRSEWGVNVCVGE